MGVAAELLAQSAHVGIHGAGVPIEMVTPGPLEELIPRLNFAAVANKLFQELEFGYGEEHLFSVNRHLVSFKVDAQTLFLPPYFGCRRRRGAAQHGTRARSISSRGLKGFTT